MPDRDPEASPNARLLTVLIWAGVGLAPVAALVVLLGGSDNSIRFAVLLVAVCVVLIGAALLIRNDPVLLKMDVEDRVEALREELREEITASAHASGNRVRALQDEMTRMRAAGSPAMGLPPASARAAAPAAGRPMGPPPMGVPPMGPPPMGGRAGVPAPAMTEPGHLPEPGHSTGGRPVPAMPEPDYPAGGRAVPGTTEAGYPAGGRAVPGMTEAGYPAGGRASAAVPGRAAVSVPGRTDGWAADEDQPPTSRPAVASASVAPPGGHTAVARIPAVAPVTGSASVPLATAGPRAAGAAAVAAAAVPHQRGNAAVPPPSGSAYQAGYVADDDEAEPQGFGGYGPGPSGSAWAERSEPVPYGGSGYDAAEPEPPAEPKPSRRHAAPDTGTDLARYGLGTDYGVDETGDATWTGTGDYHYSDPAAPSAFGIETSSFFAEAEEDQEQEPDESAQGTDYAQPADRYAQNGYGPDPMGPHHGWAPRSQEHPGRW